MNNIEKLFILFLCLFLVRMLMDLIIGFNRNEQLKYIKSALLDIEARLRTRNNIDKERIDADEEWKRELISEMNRVIVNMVWDRNADTRDEEGADD